MRYFSNSEILFSLIYAINYGILSGGFYKSALCLFRWLKELLKLPIIIWKSSNPFGFMLKKDRQNNEFNRIKNNLFDFAVFMLFGILYIILCYYTLDGVFRIYMFIFTALSFFISKNTLGAFFERLINLIFSPLYKLSFWLLYFLTFPIKRLFGALIKLIKPPIYYLILLIQRRKSKKKTAVKWREASAFLKKI